MGASRKKVGFIATGILALALTFSDVVNAQQKTRVNDNDPIALFNGASGVELNDPKVLTVEDSARVHSKSGESMGFIILRGKDAGPSAEQLKKYFEVNFKKNGVKAKVFVEELSAGNSFAFKPYLIGDNSQGIIKESEIKEKLPFLMSAQKGFTKEYYESQSIGVDLRAGNDGPTGTN